MELIVSGKTDIGVVRSNNEDNFYFNEKDGILVVADGMGGHASGEIASGIAMDIIREYFKGVKEGRPLQVGLYRKDYSKETNLLVSAVILANEAIYEAASIDQKKKGMGTTIAAVLISGRQLSIAHVGDSRVYLIRAGGILQLTEDHSVVYEQYKRGFLTKDDVEKSGMRNVLSRALGISKQVEVDCDELTLMKDDILMLCTDGLNTMVSDDEILYEVMATNNPAEACDRLIALANQKGGKDNITVIIGYLRNKSWVSFFSKIKKLFRR